MGDILSQSQIDELLKSISSGDASSVIPVEIKKEASHYDFARPSKFSKEQLRSLENIFDNYSRNLSSFFTGYLRTSVAVAVASSEQVTYSEFNNLLVNPVILAILELTPFKGSIVFEMSASIGFAIIDRILGGPGSGLKKMRDFSDLEKVLLERTVTQMLSLLPEAWENVEEVVPRLEKIETNAQFAQIIAPNEMTGLVTLTIKIGTLEGLINICIPHIVIEPIMERLNTKYWFSASEDTRDEEHSKNIESQLEKTKIEVRAEIGRSSLNINDFIGLKKGDIIPLSTYVNSDLYIYVGNEVKFRAKPGTSRGRNAIKITSLFDTN